MGYTIEITTIEVRSAQHGMLLKRGMGNGEWGMGNGEWGMDNGEWEIENGKWEIENGKLIFFLTLNF